VRGTPADTRSAQTDLIANLSALNEKLQTKVQNLEKTVKAAISEPPAKADPKEVKALKEELARARSDMAAKDEKSERTRRAVRPASPFASHPPHAHLSLSSILFLYYFPATYLPLFLSLLLPLSPSLPLLPLPTPLTPQSPPSSANTKPKSSTRAPSKPPKPPAPAPAPPWLKPPPRPRPSPKRRRRTSRPSGCTRT
jgi:hypothetical protein